MGYRLEPKVYNLKFEDYPGFECVIKSVSVDELLKIMQLTDRMGNGATEAQIRDLFTRFARQITGWNLEDGDGKKVPHTAAGLFSIQDFEFVLRLITAWVEALTGARTPTAASSRNGKTPDQVMEESIPMTGK